MIPKYSLKVKRFTRKFLDSRRFLSARKKGKSKMYLVFEQSFPEEKKYPPTLKNTKTIFIYGLIIHFIIQNGTMHHLKRTEILAFFMKEDVRGNIFFHCY